MAVFGISGVETSVTLLQSVIYHSIIPKLRGGLISLWLYKEIKLRDWKNVFTLHFPLSSTHLWLRCSNFINSPKKNYFGYAQNRKIDNRKSQRVISTPAYTCSFPVYVDWSTQRKVVMTPRNFCFECSGVGTQESVKMSVHLSFCPLLPWFLVSLLSAP
jgi:hypothetical protein